MHQSNLPRPVVGMYYLRILFWGFLRAVYLMILWPTTVFYFLAGIALLFHGEPLRFITHSTVPFLMFLPRRISHRIVRKVLPFNALLLKNPRHIRFFLLLVMVVIELIYTGIIDAEELRARRQAQTEKILGKPTMLERSLPHRFAEIFESKSAKELHKYAKQAVDSLREEGVEVCDVYIAHHDKSVQRALHVDGMLQSGSVHGTCYEDWQAMIANKDLTSLSREDREKIARYQQEEMAKSPLSAEEYEAVIETVEREELRENCEAQRKQRFQEKCLEGNGKHILLNERLTDELSQQGRRYRHVEAAHQPYAAAYACVRHTFRYVYPGGELSEHVYTVEAFVDTKTCEIVKKYPPQDSHTAR